MIAYEDLVVALTNWRINQGLPTSAVTFLSQDTGSVDLALPVADPLETAQAASVDEYGAEEVSADEYAAEEISADEYAAEEVSADEYAAEEVSADEYAAEEVSADEYAAEEVSADEYAAEEVSADEYAAEEVATDSYAAEEVADEYAAPAEEAGYEQADHATSESTQEVPLEAVEEQADLADDDGYYETAAAEEPAPEVMSEEAAAPQTEEIDALADEGEQAYDPTSNFADLEDESTVMTQDLDDMTAPSEEMVTEDPEEF
jgi:hypothetical protein